MESVLMFAVVVFLTALTLIAFVREYFYEIRYLHHQVTQRLLGLLPIRKTKQQGMRHDD